MREMYTLPRVLPYGNRRRWSELEGPQELGGPSQLNKKVSRFVINSKSQLIKRRVGEWPLA